MHRGRQRKMTASLYMAHFKNDEETGTKQGLWDRSSRRKITSMSFFSVFKACSFALVNFAPQTNANGFENAENANGFENAEK